MLKRREQQEQLEMALIAYNEQAWPPAPLCLRMAAGQLREGEDAATSPSHFQQTLENLRSTPQSQARPAKGGYTRRRPLR